MKFKKEKEMKREKEETEKEKAWSDTRHLMETYNELKSYVKNAIAEETEVDTEIYKHCEKLKGENAELNSVKASKMATAMMILNIDRAMKEIKAEYAQKGMMYKFEAFEMHYIEQKTLEEIAHRLNCGKNSPANWIKEVNRKMAIKLFGVKAL